MKNIMKWQRTVILIKRVSKKTAAESFWYLQNDEKKRKSEELTTILGTSNIYRRTEALTDSK